MDPNATKQSLKALLNTEIRVKVVDIGANPIDDAPPYSGMLRNGIAELVGFEPNPTALAKLQAAKGPNETYLPYAVCDGQRHTLNFCQAQGMTSLLEPNAAVLNLFHGFPQWSQVTAKAELDTVRLDDIPETAGVDMIKIDIQGGELMAFKNAEARLKDALVIQTEVEFLQMYVGQPLFSEVEIFLRQRGFMFHRFFPMVSRVIAPMLVGGSIYAGMSQMVWADAIFVRDLTRLDLLTDRQLLSFAAIVHECYQSLDMTLHLLNELDRRAGTHHAPTYLTSLQNKPEA